jgi:pimeloyl-ACP methyl ester carboxylesterase
VHRSIIGLAALALTSSALVGTGTTIAHGQDERKCTLSNPCFVSTSSGRMAYIEHKPSGAPSATVILLHGYTDSKRSWSLAMEELRRQDPSLRIIAVDQRGHGQSFRPRSAACRKNPGPCFTPVVMADDLAAFMAAKDIAKAYIAGHSMGSVVAQYFAKRHPERTNGAVLVASAVDLKANPVLDEWLLKGTILGQWKPALEAKGYAWPEDAIKVDLLDADPDAVEWLEINWDVDPIAPGWFVTKIAEETARVRMQTWLGVARGLGKVDNVKGLSKTKAPILALWGTQDSFFYTSDQERLISALRAASKVGGSFCWKQYGVIPLGPDGYQTDDLGHNLQWEAPRQVAKDISSFIRTGRPTSDLYRTDAPSDIKTILTERGKAELVCG